ncbi:MAG: restriction endonuclease [Acidobacteriaceae bacterium]|nr:restriction endonuclease [Acidobacteriaceae bacterium]
MFGGKVVIQAKRYKHTVAVSVVCDLYGAVQNEGASKVFSSQRVVLAEHHSNLPTESRWSCWTGAISLPTRSARRY